MELTKKQVREVTKILNSVSDDQLIYDIVMIRTLILLGEVKPAKDAMFTNDILTHEACMRGIKL